MEAFFSEEKVTAQVEGIGWAEPVRGSDGFDTDPLQESSPFLKKRTKKLLSVEPTLNRQKFFASFFQKRSASFFLLAALQAAGGESQPQRCLV